MAAAFRVEAVDGRARAGKWEAAGCGAVDTPGLLLYTRRGGLLALSPGLRDSLRPLAQGCVISTLQFLHQPEPEVLKAGGGAQKFLAMDGFVTLATNRDCIASEVSPSSSRQADALAVSVRSGGTKVTPATYMSVVEALQPSAYITLADDQPRATSKNRSQFAVDRTQKWLQDCQAIHQELGLGSRMQVFAPVVGGCYPEERARSSELAAASKADGFALCGFGCGETDDDRQLLLESAIKHLPKDKPRFVSGLGHPFEILEAIEAGADLFDCWYLEMLVNQGSALNFPLSPPATKKISEANMGEDHMKINLYSTDYRTDPLPISAGCTCFSCQNHSRAYVHHLLSVHEMLGLVLLEVHNTHHMLEFFKAVRHAVRQGKLSEYKAFICQQQEEFYLG